MTLTLQKSRLINKSRHTAQFTSNCAAIFEFIFVNKFHSNSCHWSENANFFILILIIVQRDATQSSLFIILHVHCTCFGCQPRPSWVHKTVTRASGTAATSLQRGQAWPRWREAAAQKIWPVLEAVVTVLCIPDDGCGWHPKTCRVNLQNNKESA